MPEEGSSRELKAGTCGKQQRKTRWWQEQRLTLPQELAKLRRPSEVRLVSRAAHMPGPFASALRVQRQEPAQPWRPQARLLEAEPPAPADVYINSGRTFHEHVSEDSSYDEKDPQQKVVKPGRESLLFPYLQLHQNCLWGFWQV